MRSIADIARSQGEDLGDAAARLALLQAGAAGYLLKDSIPEELVNGIRAVMRGEVVLSAEVAGLVVSEYRKALSGEQEEIRLSEDLERGRFD